MQAIDTILKKTTKYACNETGLNNLTSSMYTAADVARACQKNH